MAEKEIVTHSVTLDKDKCKGCTNCIKRCPTEAIRVRDGKAKILKERCIDCGECIRVCPHLAKKAVYDDFESNMARFQYKVALPAPTLYGQFNNMDDIDYILSGLLKIGFDSVFEVARAAEIVSDYTRMLLHTGKLQRPVISSACPTVVRLIRARFPNLCEHVLPVMTPAELAARIARDEAVSRSGLAPEEIGVFFISPCPAKVTAARYPLNLEESGIDGVFAISDIYFRLVAEMERNLPSESMAGSGIMGISWAQSGGEASALLKEKYLAADGIENVVKVLEEMEDEKLQDLDFVELNACVGGCVGGVLTVENPFVAKARIQALRKFLPVACNQYQDVNGRSLEWEKELEPAQVLQLSGDLFTAMQMLQKIDRLEKELPALDCGSCGAPSCRCLAEDVVRGYAHETDCLFQLREKIGAIYSELAAFRTRPARPEEERDNGGENK